MKTKTLYKACATSLTMWCRALVSVQGVPASLSATWTNAIEREAACFVFTNKSIASSGLSLIRSRITCNVFLWEGGVLEMFKAAQNPSLTSLSDIPGWLKELNLGVCWVVFLCPCLLRHLSALVPGWLHYSFPWLWAWNATQIELGYCVLGNFGFALVLACCFPSWCT